MKYIILAFLPFLFTSCKSRGNIETGTTIVVYACQDSIIVASDSKVGTYIKNGIAYNRGKKIFHKGKIVFAFQGIVFDTDSTDIKNLYNKKLSMYENTIVIKNMYIKEYTDYINGFTFDQYKIFKEKMAKDFHSTFFICGFEKKKPMICVVETYYNTHREYIAYTIHVDSNSTSFNCGGFAEHIDKKREEGYELPKNKLNGIIDLIKLEAREHVEVDSNVNYAIIKKSKVVFGNNY